MDFQERQRLVRRITSGKFYTSIEYQNNTYEIMFKEPSLDLLTYSDYIYQKFYDKAKENGGLTIQDTYEVLRKDGRWTDAQEKDLDNLEKEIESLEQQLPLNKYNKTAQRAIKNTIETKQKKRWDLFSTKNQLMSFSIENMAEIQRQTYLISKCVQLPSDELFTNTKFLENLRVLIFEDCAITESQIRELSRSDPFRLYWSSCKDSGIPLFSHSATEFTNTQYLLVLWAKIYDSAFQASPRPSDEIINEDKRFDAWYRAEAAKQKSEAEKTAVDDSLGTKGDQIFIPADKEGAKEIYALNNAQAMAAIRSQQAVIVQKGEVKETELPNVRQEINMELNRMQASQIKK